MPTKKKPTPPPGLVAAPSAPTINSITAANESAIVNFTLGANGGSALTNHEYSLDGGSWIPFSPARTTSPANIPNLVNRRVYDVRLRARNADGVSPPSNEVRVEPNDTIAGNENGWDDVSVYANAGMGLKNYDWGDPDD